MFQLQRCYLKDASLEMPHAPEILLQAQQEQPQVDIKFEVSQKTVAEALYDVTVRGTITVKAADKVIILVEGTQSVFSPSTAFRSRPCSMSRMSSARPWSIRTSAPTSPT